MRTHLLTGALFLGLSAIAMADQPKQAPTTAVMPLPPSSAPTHYDIPSEPLSIYLGIIAATVFGVLVYAYKTSDKNKK
jgi:hypothetical protein